ncbi:RNA polymerase sigma-70 region 4 [uncultured Caudovirales phage]|uniref:RNA polymerase sigma-70 region 4 n=1 Tax=uncultured Caudovirales phage TaxID=2100421 RepID=A0A6J5LJJ3_9CAUD|nr:RNA polymerase sigma-70 region 4 [uncultured Caudovirales phage]CAB4134341.1 RNA polymerase sigma-70 region 4 [uncultured Caudovirales phage]
MTDAETIAILKQRIKELEEMLNFTDGELHLTTREQEILKMRYHADGTFKTTLREMGRIFNCTPERIRQITVKALRKLRQPSRHEDLKRFLEEDDE